MSAPPAPLRRASESAQSCAAPPHQLQASIERHGCEVKSTCAGPLVWRVERQLPPGAAAYSWQLELPRWTSNPPPACLKPLTCGIRIHDEGRRAAQALAGARQQAAARRVPPIAVSLHALPLHGTGAAVARAWKICSNDSLGCVVCGAASGTNASQDTMWRHPRRA